MLRAWIKFLRWNLRTFWYPTLRVLGRLTGQGDRVKQWITLSEENLTNSLDTLGGDDE